MTISSVIFIGKYIKWTPCIAITHLWMSYAIHMTEKHWHHQDSNPQHLSSNLYTLAIAASHLVLQ